MNCDTPIQMKINYPDKKRKFDYINKDRTINAYGPLYYCFICCQYYDWVCFAKFHKIKLKEYEKYSISFLKEHNDIDYDDEELQIEEKNKEYQNKTNETLFSPEIYDEIFNYKNEKINEVIDKGDYYGHTRVHPCLVISSKHIEVLFSNSIDYSL